MILSITGMIQVNYRYDTVNYRYDTVNYRYDTVNYRNDTGKLQIRYCQLPI